MPIEKEKQGWLVGRIVAKRRSGFDRRVLTYDWYIPEHRTILNRRHTQKAFTNSHLEWRGRQKYA